MMEQMLELAMIRIDGDTQPRVAIDQLVVTEYAEAMQSGAEFPAVRVIHDGAAYWLVDGFHRFFAHRRLNRLQIRAEIIAGELPEAQWQRLAANKSHGLRRTNGDKAKAVMKALKMRSDASDRAIAEHVGVTAPTVSKYRATLAATVTNLQSNSRIGRDGRNINTANIRHNAARRHGKPAIAKNAFIPIRGHSTPAPMRALNMPCDPVMGARTLIELFDAEYLRAVVSFLTKHLEGIAA